MITVPFLKIPLNGHTFIERSSAIFTFVSLINQVQNEDFAP